MKKYDGDVKHLYPHNILFCWTSDQDYEMERMMLLGDMLGVDDPWNTYIVVEGWHCSCYDFDETEWDAIEYTREELEKLASATYYEDHPFWQMVKRYLTH